MLFRIRNILVLSLCLTLGSNLNEAVAMRDLPQISKGDCRIYAISGLPLRRALKKSSSLNINAKRAEGIIIPHPGWQKPGSHDSRDVGELHNCDFLQKTSINVSENSEPSCSFTPIKYAEQKKAAHFYLVPYFMPAPEHTCSRIFITHRYKVSLESKNDDWTVIDIDAEEIELMCPPFRYDSSGHLLFTYGNTISPPTC